MIYRSKAPLRIGLAGGGTDVSPYSDLYGGAILNATISLYAYATIEPLEEKKILLETNDRNESDRFADLLNVETRRTMSRGILNPLEPESLSMIRRIIASMLESQAGRHRGRLWRAVARRHVRHMRGAKHAKPHIKHVKHVRHAKHARKHVKLVRHAKPATRSGTN